MGCEWLKPRSENRYFNPCNSEASAAREWYSALPKEWEKMDCFLVFQKIKLELNMVK